MKLGISNLCLPSKIYLGLAILSIVVSLIISVETMWMSFIHIIFAIFWTWVLNLICKNGTAYISWILVLVPIIIYSFVVLSVLMEVRKEVKEEKRATNGKM
jgi:hypothetical protein